MGRIIEIEYRIPDRTGEGLGIYVDKLAKILTRKKGKKKLSDRKEKLSGTMIEGYTEKETFGGER